LLSTDARTRQSALELLDETLKGGVLHDQVMRVFEGAGTQRQPLSAQAAASRLAYANDALLRGLARRSLEHIGLEAGVPLISTIAAFLSESHEPEQEDMPQPIVERILLLESVTMFSSASVDDLAAVAQICIERPLAPFDEVFREGEPGDEMFIVARGEVALEKHGRTLLTIAKGESFGQVSVLDRGLRPATARAGKDGAELFVIARQPFMDLVTDRPELLNGLFAVLTKRLRDLLELQEPEPATVAS
jgi:hypothetical protein